MFTNTGKLINDAVGFDLNNFVFAKADHILIDHNMIQMISQYNMMLSFKSNND